MDPPDPRSPEHRESRFTSLKVKLLEVIVLVSAVFTLIATITQLYFEYRTDVELLGQRIEQIRQSHLPALELSIWSLDTQLINTQLESLESLPDVYAAQLSTRYGESYQAGPAIDGKNLKRYTIDMWTRDAQSLELGTLTLYSDLDVVFDRVIERGKVIILTLGVRTFFVSLGILLIVHLMVTRHLAGLAQYLKGLGLEKLASPFSFHRHRNHRPDEFDTIVTALDEMRQKMQSDVDQLNALREDLEQSERKYRLAMNATRDGLWDWNIETGCVDYSPAWRRIIGEEEIDPVLESWTSRLHEQDRGKALESLDAHLRGVTSTWQHEHRLRNAQQQWVWVLGRGEVVERDRFGKPTRMLGTMTNIHARKMIEEAHRESEEKVTLLLNSTAESIYGIDLEGRCSFVNPACIRTLGYKSADELIGKNMHDLIHHTTSDGKKYPFGDCPINLACRKGQGMHADDELFWRKDGSSIPVEYWSYPMRRHDQVTGAVVTFLDITERLHDKQVLEHLATHDALTGVNNRKQFDTRLGEEMGRAGRYQRELSLIMIDIDHFKHINDAYGHPVGDQVLQAFAEVIKDSIRQHDCAGRYGGEEFVILLPETSLQDAVDFAERLRKQVAALSIDAGGKGSIRITASFGVSSFPEPSADREQLIKLADDAMYRAKNSGRNSVQSAPIG